MGTRHNIFLLVHKSGKYKTISCVDRNFVIYPVVYARMVA